MVSSWEKFRTALCHLPITRQGQPCGRLEMGINTTYINGNGGCLVGSTVTVRRAGGSDTYIVGVADSHLGQLDQPGQDGEMVIMPLPLREISRSITCSLAVARLCSIRISYLRVKIGGISQGRAHRSGNFPTSGWQRLWRVRFPVDTKIGSFRVTSETVKFLTPYS